MPVPAPTAFLPSGLARPGAFRLFAAERGGDVLLDELRPTSLTFQRRVNQQAVASATVPAGSSGVLGGLRSWAHELVVVRDDEVVWCGPIVKPKWAGDDVTLPAPDVGLGWLSVRDVVQDQSYANTDVSRIAARIVADTLAIENSMGLTVIEHGGIGADAEFQRRQHQKVADALNSLVAKGLRYTTHVRRLLLGAVSEPPLIFTDDSFEKPNIEEGDAASKVTAIGAQTMGVNEPVEAAHGGTSSEMGLVERTINDQRVTTQDSAIAMSAMALSDSKPPPVIVSGVLKAAAIRFNDLIAGRAAVAKLDSLDRVVDESNLALLQVDVTIQAGQSEDVSIVLGPLT